MARTLLLQLEPLDTQIVQLMPPHLTPGLLFRSLLDMASPLGLRLSLLIDFILLTNQILVQRFAERLQQAFSDTDTVRTWGGSRG